MEELGAVPEMEKPLETVETPETKVEATAEVKPIDFDDAGNFKSLLYPLTLRSCPTVQLWKAPRHRKI